MLNDFLLQVLYQTPYNGDKEPYHPVVDYHCVRLSDILTDTAAVDNCGGPAYGRSIVGGQKLSLRLQVRILTCIHERRPSSLT